MPAAAMTASRDQVGARKDLVRTLGFAQRDSGLADDETDDGFTIDGYATVYGRDLRAGEAPSAAAGWTQIDSWEGCFWERFVFGTFRKSLRERTPRMQFDHGSHPLLGSLPLGRWDSITEEADRGLHTIGRMSDNWLVEPFRLAIADDAVDGMSIRFEVIREEWRDAEGKLIKPEDVSEMLWESYKASRRGEDVPLLLRSVKEAKLPEAGPVTWPAYGQTSVGVRNAAPTGRVVIDLAQISEPGQLSALARAVAAADAAAATRSESEPPATDPAAPADDADEGTGSADGHLDDASQSTTPEESQATADSAAGEHPDGTPAPAMDEIDAARARSADYEFARALAEIDASLALTITKEL